MLLWNSYYLNTVIIDCYEKYLTYKLLSNVINCYVNYNYEEVVVTRC